MKLTVLLCVFLYMCILHHAHGSKIILQATPDEVLEGLTSTLTLRCWLNDTAASASIVGRRDVTSTTDNVAEVTSLVFMKDGKDIASITPHKPAHIMDGSTNVQVSGSISPSAIEQGFIEITIQDPTINQTGEYTCEVNAVSQSGHIVTFSTTREVGSHPPSMSDMANYIRQVKREKDILEQKYNTQVYFSAGFTHSLDVPSGDHVITFDRIFSNIGGGYNNSNGLFTCTTPGDYHFFITAMSAYTQKYYVHLQHNNNNVVAIYGLATDGNDDQSSNNVILRLAVGDVVRAVAHSGSHIRNAGSYVYTTFTGLLVGQV